MSTASLTMGDFCQQEGATDRPVCEVPKGALRERGFVARMRAPWEEPSQQRAPVRRLRPCGLGKETLKSQRVSRLAGKARSTDRPCASGWRDAGVRVRVRCGGRATGCGRRGRIVEAAPHTWCQEREACGAVQKEERPLAIVPIPSQPGVFTPLPLLFAPYPTFSDSFYRTDPETVLLGCSLIECSPSGR